MNGILEYKRLSDRSEYTGKLLRAAEQRINFVYMLIMSAFEVSVIIYIIVHTWDDSRYYYGGFSAASLLIGIIVNVICLIRRKNYPWLRFLNSGVMIFSLWAICGLSDYMAVVFVMVPFINSFYFRPRFTAVTGVICLIMSYIGLMVKLVPAYDINGNPNPSLLNTIFSAFNYSDSIKLETLGEQTFLLIVVAAFVIVSVYLSLNGRRFTLRQGELIQKNLSTETELNVARNIQEGILSADFPDNSSYAVCADMTPATQVGGDFYDYFPVDETHLAVVVGDVSGHGMAAAMFMTLSKTLIKVYAQANHSCEKVLEKTNRYLLQSNPAKFFVTGWIGILDLTDGVLTYSNAGHNYPVIIRGGKPPEFLRSKPNFVLGRKRLVRYVENRTKLAPGDRLILYTDGVTEAKSPDDEFFGDDRLLEVIGSAGASDQKQLVSALRKAIDDFEQGTEHHDDATVLALSFKDFLVVEPPESKSFFLSVETFDEVTDYVADRCAAAGCDEATVGQIKIAVSEVLANIDSYAYENGGEVEILTKCHNRVMTITFKDNGKPFNPLLVKEPDVTVELRRRKQGGLGIFIVKKLMSNVRYSYDGKKNILTLEKDF